MMFYMLLPEPAAVTGRIAGEAERLLTEAGALYAEALAAGYRGALHLDGSCADAHVGAAEAHVALGKLAGAGTNVGCLLVQVIFKYRLHRPRRTLRWVTSRLQVQLHHMLDIPAVSVIAFVDEGPTSA